LILSKLKLPPGNEDTDSIILSRDILSLTCEPYMCLDPRGTHMSVTDCHGRISLNPRTGNEIPQYCTT
uniref:Uncharacterized protein n=1 Tax=Oryza brachyantha TaxID=4533 RepID=J3KZZ4_ORYBR